MRGTLHLGEPMAENATPPFSSGRQTKRDVPPPPPPPGSSWHTPPPDPPQTGSYSTAGSRGLHPSLPETTPLTRLY